MSENQATLQEPEGRSQKLTLSDKSDDKIVIDRKTFKQILALLGRSVQQLEHSRHCEIFLTSLDKHLSESDSPEAYKSLLLLNYWLDVMPESFEEIARWLDKAEELMQLILTASKTGELVND